MLFISCLFAMKFLSILILSTQTSFAFQIPMTNRRTSAYLPNPNTNTRTWNEDTKTESSTSDTINSLSTYKAILFDIDGTLADSWKLGFDATVAILENNNIPPITEEIYHDCTRYCTPDRLARHAGLHPIDDKEKFEEIGNKLAKEFDEMYVDLVSTTTAGFYPGIHTTIQSIPSDVKVGALTNACVAYAHAVLKVNSMQDRFISVHGADSVPKPKPHPDGLLQCCIEMNVDPCHCVYVGDSPSDALAAKAANMPCIGVSWGSHSMESVKNAPFMHICSSVEELKQLLY